ncbi:hypothetical protein [uncultured Corynebacterium sp.]|uniref:hypothetical protein n=1 Tax=uncultured Corynebacterium sp. TaxID=159447 RepID=UPI0025EC9F2A|nr:hypothetical protein [uncultured Corynebacterium sp.]
MKPRINRTAPALFALAASALTLVACGAADEGTAEAEATETSAAVSVDPDAPELDENEGAYNFLLLDDDGRSHILGHVRVMSSGDWLGLSDGDVEFTALDDGEYRVIARGASGCPGVGETTDDGLGVIGEIHADSGAAKVWGTPVESEVESFATVVLADSDDEVLSCGKAVDWTEPSTSAAASSTTAAS